MIIISALAAGVAGSAPARVSGEERRPYCEPGLPFFRCYTPGDYDGDRKADLAMFRPEEGVWYVKRSTDNEPDAVRWGLSGDKLVPADYDGDRKDDFAVFRPSESLPPDAIPSHANWYIYYSSQRKWLSKQFGNSLSSPAPGDYDGDGKADIAVAQHGVYRIIPSTNESTVIVVTLPTGDPDELEDSNHNDINVPGDYDGDGVTDPAVYDEQEPETRPGEVTPEHDGERVWVILRSTAGLVRVPLGAGEDVPVPGDYNGDGKTDVAVWHAEDCTWSIIENLDAGVSEHSVRVVEWGEPDDVVTPADYDGDGKTDLAVWRPVERIWEILLSESETNQSVIHYWGISSDIPVPMSLKREVY